MNDRLDLTGRVALVTGAGSGIGRASALLMAEHGARIGVLGRTEADLHSLVAEIEGRGGEGLVLYVDITEPARMRQAFDRLIERWGRLDIVFANAGVNGVWAPIEELELEEWSRTIAINLTGTFLTLKLAAPHLKKQGGSVIVNASINGTRVFSNTGATAYASSKAGQVGMAKMLALEFAAHHVRVNIVCPGAIETNINAKTVHRDVADLGVPVVFPKGWHPLRGKPGSPEQVAQVVLFLASDAASHVTGTELWVDGGESLIGIHG